MPEALPDAEEHRNGTRVLALLSLIVGVVSGLVCATFRLVLQRADALRGGLIALAYGLGALGLLLVIAGAAPPTAVAGGGGGLI
jgi:CIC family chloride channel protein